MSLGQGLTKLKDKVFRIGHLGDINDLTLCGTLAGVEMGLALAGVPHQKGGAQAAMEYLTQKQRFDTGKTCNQHSFTSGAIRGRDTIQHPHNGKKEVQIKFKSSNRMIRKADVKEKM